MEGVTDRLVTACGSSMCLDVDEQSQIGAARRSAVARGRTQNLDADALGRLAIVVTEAATNIVLHAGHGVIVLRCLTAGGSPGIEVLALDKGPGIYDVERALRDGYSTTGTAGRGLGGIKRLSDVFEMHSERGMGTAVLARVCERGAVVDRAPRAQSLDDRLGVVCVPLRGETECGDAWRVVADKHRIAVLLVDGLGHGPEAASAAAIATTTFGQHASGSPDDALVALDAAMRDTRGAAVSVVVIDEAVRSVRFCGVGNVHARVFKHGPTEYLVPQNGIVGHGMPPVRSSDAVWHVGARLVMHSDGILAKWRMDAYGKLKTAHPALLAGVIYRDFARGKDDATVLVLADGTAGP